MGMLPLKIQTNFTAGELSPRLYGRVDNEKYYNALKTMFNMVAFVHGGATRRCGTVSVAEAHRQDKLSRLLPFIFSTTQNYVLEMGYQIMRVFRLRGQVVTSAGTVTAITKANPGIVTTAAPHGLSPGDRFFLDDVVGMVQVNGRQYIAGATTAGSDIELDDLDGNNVNTTNFTTYSSGGSVSKAFTVATPWLDTQLADLKFTQSADTLYTCHPTVAPRKTTRTSDTSWSITDMTSLLKDGPYMDINVSATTITPSATTGAITLTASATTGINGGSGFLTTDVNRLVRLLIGGTWGYARITARTSSTVVDATVLSTLGGTTATANWRLGAFSDTTGWPATVCFFQQRLVFGGTTSQPQTVWGSCSGDYENFAPSNASGTVADSNAFTFTIADEQVNAIRALSPAKTLLQVLTSQGEHSIYGGSQGAIIAVTPTNVTISRESSRGSVSNVRPVRVGNEIFFVQPSRRRIRAMGYNSASDGFVTKDVTLLSEHITKSGIVDMDFQNEIDSIVWAVRSDGALIGITYDSDQKVIGPSRHVIGGSYQGGIAQVKSVAVIPSPNAEEGSDLWMIVRRTIDGNTRYMIEYVSAPYDPDTNGQDSMFFADAGLFYDGFLDSSISLSALTGSGVTVTAGSAVFTANMIGRKIYGGAGGQYGKALITAYTDTTHVTVTIEQDFNINVFSSGGWSMARQTFNNMWHLEGEECVVSVDGAAHPNVTVDTGAFSLDGFYSRVVVGLGYNSDMQLLPPEQPPGTTQGLTHRISEVFLRFYQTLGAKYGKDANNLDIIPARSSSDIMDVAPPLFTGPLRLKFDAGYTDDPVVYIRQDQALPLTVLFASLKYEANEYG